MEDKTIAKWQITASSHFRNYEPWQARLRSGRSWATKTQSPSSPWIQVQFMNSVVITGMQTQGGEYWNESRYDNWVKTLHVEYEKDHTGWSYIMDGNEKMVGVSLLLKFAGSHVKFSAEFIYV